ncbi:MAG: retroviral-like aspartic protease family protein [Syntrophobacteraceae bacterium]
MRLRTFSAACAVFLMSLCCDCIEAIEIQLVDRGGIFTLPVKINGNITLQFMVDTGTPEVVVPDDIAITLIQSGTIKEIDFLPGSPYKLTDGSVLKSPRFNLRELEIGGMRVDNVRCSVDSQVPELVLGEDLLNRFASWELDNARKVLILGSVKNLMASPKDISSRSPTDAIQLPSTLSSGQQDLPQRSRMEQPPLIDIKKNRFGSFYYTYKKQTPDNVYTFQLMAGKHQILADESYLQIPPLRVFKDMPSPGCQSAVTSLYSGGAHCCTTAILLTICGGRERAFVVDLSSSGVEQLQLLNLKKDGNHQVSILDLSFAYYSANDDLSLSFASSPIVRRLLIFDGTDWIPDTRGMFPQFYVSLLQKTEKDMKRLRTGLDYEQEHVSFAVMRTFYSIMAGKADNECQAMLVKDLPKSWKIAGSKIYDDIKTAITSYQPVKVLQ